MDKQCTHNEAFCHMKYQTKDGRETEVIWNSRDGVTPFIVHSRSGKEMQHINWQQDRRDETYKPVAGDRIFVDATPELVRVKVQAYVEKYWDAANEKSHIPSMAHVFEGQTKEEVVENFIKDWTQPGSPMIVSVQEDGSYVSA